MKGKQLRQRIDFTLILAVTALVGFSIIMIGSAGGRTFDLLHITLGPSMKRQLLGFALGLVFATVLMLVSRELLNFLTIPIYFFMLLLLLIVLLIGIGSGAEGEEEGVHRWIQLIGGFTLQPSEFAKFFIIIVLARFCDVRSDRINRFGVLLAFGAILVLPFYLVLKEPDLSTSIILIAIGAAILFTAGLNWKYILAAFLIAGIGIYVILADAYNPDGPRILSEYQAMRIWAFITPEKYAENYAYQTLRSQYAISSVGLTGVGLFNSSGLIPVPMTDFIFAILGEELGFIGCSIMMGIMTLIVGHIIRISTMVRDTYGKLICVGVATWIATQSFIHIGVNTAVLPNTGIPLPFMSYGPSSLVAIMGGIGLVLHVYYHHKMQEELRRSPNTETGGTQLEHRFGSY